MNKNKAESRTLLPGAKPLKEVPFRLIVITPAENIPGEQAIIRELFAAGLSRLHVRKPGMTTSRIQAYLEAYTRGERSRIRVHHTGSSLPYTGIAGLHLPCPAPGSTPTLPGSVSTSVHSWEEYGKLPPEIEYAFLSPLFNSISKKGYRQNPGIWEPPSRLQVPVIGLGGINEGNIRKVLQAGFSGAALLGAVWEQPGRAVEIFNGIRNLLGPESLPGQEDGASPPREGLQKPGAKDSSL